MGLYADISGQHTSTKVDMKDVYLRINQVNIYPKYGVIKIAVSGYLNKESGQLLRNPEYESVPDYWCEHYERCSDHDGIHGEQG